MSSLKLHSFYFYKRMKTYYLREFLVGKSDIIGLFRPLQNSAHRFLTLAFGFFHVCNASALYIFYLRTVFQHDEIDEVFKNRNLGKNILW